VCRGLQQRLTGDRQPQSADAARTDVGTCLQERDGGVVVLLGRPPEGVRITVAAALAALFFDGTYEPTRVRPSLVRSVTASAGAPRLTSVTTPRPRWVNRYPAPVGNTTLMAMNRPTRSIASR
jgi:hypothetical protein